MAKALFFLDDFALRQFEASFKGARINYDPVCMCICAMLTCPAVIIHTAAQP